MLNIDLLSFSYASRVILMKQGRILASGETDSVLSSSLVGETYDVNIELGRTSTGLLSVSGSI